MPRRPRPRGTLIVAVLPTALALMTVTLATAVSAHSAAARLHAPRGAPLTATPIAGSAEFTAVSPSLAVTNLAYSGEVQTTSGTVMFTALRFTADELDATGLTIAEPCFTNPALTQSFNVTQTVANTATATLAGPVVLIATSLSYTPSGGPTVTYDATTQPAPGVLVASGTLPQVEITAADLTAASVSAPQQHVQVGLC